MCRFIQYIVLYASFCAPYKLINKPEVQKFLTNDADYSTAEEWTFFFKFPEGIQLIQQIYFTHNSPTRMYNRFIKQIDETASAIDEFYK